MSSSQVENDVCLPTSNQEELLDKALKRTMSSTPVGDKGDLDSLVCPICMDVLRDPVMHQNCSNMFCSICAKRISTCPLCHTDMKENEFVPVPKMILDMIEKVNVRCNGCESVMTREEYTNNHKGKCTFECPFGCGQKVNSSNLVEHCKGGFCNGYFVSCPAALPPLSCGWRGRGGEEYRIHVDQCQLNKLIPFVTATQKKINELERTVERLQQTIVRVDESIEARVLEVVRGMSNLPPPPPSSSSSSVLPPSSSSVINESPEESTVISLEEGCCCCCPNGHPFRQVLVQQLGMENPMCMNGVKCDACMRHIPPNETVYRCDTCQYNLCNSCNGQDASAPSAPTAPAPWDSVDSNNCPQGHSLRTVLMTDLVSDMAYKGGCWCSKCKSPIGPSEIVHHCDLCHYDVCSSCHGGCADDQTSVQLQESCIQSSSSAISKIHCPNGHSLIMTSMDMCQPNRYINGPVKCAKCDSIISGCYYRCEQCDLNYCSNCST